MTSYRQSYTLPYSPDLAGEASTALSDDFAVSSTQLMGSNGLPVAGYGVLGAKWAQLESHPGARTLCAINSRLQAAELGLTLTATTSTLAVSRSVAIQQALPQPVEGVEQSLHITCRHSIASCKNQLANGSRQASPSSIVSAIYLPLDAGLAQGYAVGQQWRAGTLPTAMTGQAISVASGMWDLGSGIVLKDRQLDRIDGLLCPYARIRLGRLRQGTETSCRFMLELSSNGMDWRVINELLPSALPNAMAFNWVGYILSVIPAVTETAGVITDPVLHARSYCDFVRVEAKPFDDTSMSMGGVATLGAV